MLFSLFANPFVRVSATPATRQDELAERAAAIGTPEAMAALSTLLAPRTRLSAEIAFLPGESVRALAIVEALRLGERIHTGDLSAPAAANVLAHLCAAGAVERDVLLGLVDAQTVRGSPLLLAIVARDRAAAEFPPPQPPMLVAAQDELAEVHARIVADACVRGLHPAKTLAALIVDSTHSPSPATLPFLRRVALVWAREVAGAAGEAEAGVARAEATLKARPSDTSADTFIGAATSWAEFTAPERLVDAQLGLDHEPSALKARRWREVTSDLATRGHEALAAKVAETLLEVLGDLPGFAALLRRDQEIYAARARDRLLAAVFEPLSALIADVEGSPGPFLDNVVRLGFRANAAGQVGELWRAFQAAKAAAAGSETPWMLMHGFAGRLEAKLDAAAAALAVVQGLLRHPEPENASEWLAQLRTRERRLLRKIGIARLQRLAPRWRDSRAALRTLESLLPLADDPALTQQLKATRQRLVSRVATLSAGAFVTVAVMVLIVIGVMRSVVSGPAAGGGGATPSMAASQSMMGGAIAPTIGSTDPPPVSTSSNLPLEATIPSLSHSPAAAPFPAAPDAHPVTSIVPRYDASTPEETKPEDSDHVFSLPEVRWCQFNNARLSAVRAQLRDQSAARRDSFDELARPWDALCRDYPAHRSDAARIKRELKDYHEALRLQAQQLLLQIEDARP